MSKLMLIVSTFTENYENFWDRVLKGQQNIWGRYFKYFAICLQSCQNASHHFHSSKITTSNRQIVKNRQFLNVFELKTKLRTTCQVLSYA